MTQIGKGLYSERMLFMSGILKIEITEDLLMPPKKRSSNFSSLSIPRPATASVRRRGSGLIAESPFPYPYLYRGVQLGLLAYQLGPKATVLRLLYLER
jgi:hypothetical protein